MSDITTEDLKITDLFSQAQLEAEQYDPEMAALYCQYIMEGRSLIAAASGVYQTMNEDEVFDLDDPADVELLRQKGRYLYAKFNRWRVKFDRFEQMVNLAIKQRCYAYVEEMIEIADDATDDATMGAMGPTINGKAIRRAELMINTRKFIAGKMLPKVFGDKTQMELTGADGKDLVPTTFNIQLVPAGNFIPASEAAAAAEENQSG